MKRRLFFLAAFLVVVLSGCNREQIADLILTVGFHPAFDLPQGDPTGKTTNAASLPVAHQSSEQLLSAMFETREVRQAAGQANVERIHGIINRIHVSGEELANAKGLTATECRQIREAEFAALQLAVELAPTQFTAARDAFRVSHFQQQLLDANCAEASAMRIVDEYLTAKEMSPNAQFALKLHALTYPNCSMNVQLFSTMAERLANEKQLKASIQIATDGIKLCSQLPDAQKLQGQLDRIFAEQPAAPGLPFRLSGPTMDGAVVNIADFRGRVVVVTFWASWCPTCREEIGALRKLQDAYQQEEVDFVGVSLDENHAEFSQYLQNNRVTWPQIFVAKKGQTRWNNPLVRYYRVTSIPYTVIVDKQGIIAESGVRGEADIENAILDLLID